MRASAKDGRADWLPAEVVPGQQPDPARPLAPGEPRYYSHWRPKPEGAWFNPIAAHNAVAFFPKYCRLTSDEWRGKPFHLEPWQADWIIRQTFGWMRADGTRLYRRVIVWVPKKNGKSEMVAGIAHLCLLGDAVGAAEAYAIATKGKQADNLFATAKAMVSFSPELAAHYDVFRESLYLCATGSTFQPLTGTARGKDGFKTTYLFGDEVHEWASDELYSIVREGVASRREPLEFLISTAGVHHGYGVRLWEESVKICEGAYDDPETLVAIWCAPQDPEVEIDIQDPTVWHEANPNLGKSKRYDFMVKAAREAAQDTAAENTFKRKHLNIWVGQNERWLPMPFWHACNYGDPDRWKDIARDMRGRKCWGGLDLASTRDFCALVWVFPPEGDERHYTVLPRLWWPKLSMQAAAQKSRVPFESWAFIKAFEATPGSTADHDLIFETILQDSETFEILGLGIDNWNATFLASRLMEKDVPVELIRFGMMSMSQPSKLLEKLVFDGLMDHGGHPVLTWMASNTAIRRDGNDNYYPHKAASANKIDGIAALVMALAMSGKQAPEESYLATSSLLVLR